MRLLLGPPTWLWSWPHSGRGDGAVMFAHRSAKACNPLARSDTADVAMSQWTPQPSKSERSYHATFRARACAALAASRCRGARESAVRTPRANGTSSDARTRNAVFCGSIQSARRGYGMAYETYFTHAVPRGCAPTGCAWSAPARGRALQVGLPCLALGLRKCDAAPISSWFLALPILLSRIQCDSGYSASLSRGRRKGACSMSDAVTLGVEARPGLDAEGVDFDAQAVDAARRKGLSVGLEVWPSSATRTSHSIWF